MKRCFPILGLVSFLLVACSTTRPAPEPVVDPGTEPTIVGALDEAVLQGSIEGEEAARVGRHIGRVAGVLAAVLGGSEVESVDDVIDRYRDTRDAVEITAAVIGATNGAVAGAKRGLELDQQFAELLEIEGLQVTRPAPDRIDVVFLAEPDEELLAKVIPIFANREARDFYIEAPAETARAINDALHAHALNANSIYTHPNEDIEHPRLLIRYKE
ncbi:MAG TPA: hypothetical protein VGF69_14400 [Thermoanaerobaculia bacterium]